MLISSFIYRYYCVELAKLLKQNMTKSSKIFDFYSYLARRIHVSIVAVIVMLDYNRNRGLRHERRHV